MPDQSNKPGSKPGDPDTEPAVENQGQATPEDYPDPASGNDTGAGVPDASDRSRGHSAGR